jgi:Astacin (Peptidase family M12A)/Papain-like cysteine protease AvrRpt2
MKKSIIYIRFLLIILPIHMIAQETAKVKVRLPLTTGEQVITVTVRNGIAFLQDDIELGAYTPPSGRGGAELIGSVANLQNGAWANNEIPYEVQLRHPLQREILKAIDNINKQTNLQIIPKRAKHTNWVQFTSVPPGSLVGGSSSLGCIGGMQEIELNPSGASVGTIMHEILHAAGIMHEQCRPDRDEYVDIDLSAVPDGKKHNFEICQFVSTSSPYDFNSIMHYPASAFVQASGFYSITVKPKYRNQLKSKLGQRDALSAGDIATINRIYPKSAASSSRKGSNAASSSNSSGTLSNDVGTGASSFHIEYEVPLIPQPTKMSCWAAAVAMIYVWLREQEGIKIKIDPQQIKRKVGVWKDFSIEIDSTGLNPDDVRIFNKLHFCCEAPMCYTVEGFKELIAFYGPLWVAGASPSPHARVVYGVYGDGTPDNTILMVHDPWGSNLPQDPKPADMAKNKGSSYEMPFVKFMTQIENLGSRELNVPQPIYVVHSPRGEGKCGCD